ncbi:UBA domain-containing protein [[Candida] zeylanoides]
MSESNDAKISQLVDMGFTPEQAQRALALSNNNVESAISYLFEDPVEIDDSNPPPPPQRSPASETPGTLTPMDTVAVSNPLDIPDFSGYSVPVQSQEHEVENSDSDSPDKLVRVRPAENSPASVSVASTASSLGTALSPTTGDAMDYPESIFDKLHAYHHDPSIPKSVVPLSPHDANNNFTTFIVILSQIQSVVQVFFNKNFDFNEYGWDKEWFREGILKVLPPIGLNHEAEQTYRLVVEIQRIFAFLTDGESHRLFMSSRNLLANLPIHFSNESIEEIIPKIYECINDCVLALVAKVGSDESKVGIGQTLEKLFRSVVYSVAEDQTNNIYHIDIESSSSHRNLYDSFNELIWGNDLEQLGQIYFTELSEILTVSQIGDSLYEQQHESHFEVLEEFYPDIYSEKYRELVVGMNHEKESSFRRKVELVKELNKLSFFEGKKIKTVLDTVIEVLPDEAIKDELKEVQEEIESAKASLNAEMSDLGMNSNECDILNHRNVLRRIQAQITNIEPYILVGIVESSNNYAYRERTSDKWINVRFVIDNASDVVEDIECERLDGLPEVLSARSKVPYRYISTPSVTSVYVKKSTWYQPEAQMEISHALKSFFKRDNAHKEQLNKKSIGSSEDAI